MWRFLEWTINGPIGQAIRSKVAGRMGMGAFFGALVGGIPSAVLITHGELWGAAAIGAGTGAVIGYFYHRGYVDAEYYWRERHRFEQEMLEKARRRELGFKDDDG